MRSYNSRTASVWWDINSCPVPSGFDPGEVGPRIKLALNDLSYFGAHTTITAIGNLTHIPSDVLRMISSTGIALRHVNSEYGTDMVKWTECNSRWVSLMVIASHERLAELGRTIFYLRNKGRKILVAYLEEKHKDFAWLRKSFLASPSKEWVWKTLLEGDFPMDNKEEDMYIGMGKFSCKICDSCWESFEDFATHINKCQVHAQVPRPLDNTSSPSTSTRRPKVTSVYWDIKSCPVPIRFDPRLVGRRIESALKNSGYSGRITITAIGNLEDTTNHDVLGQLYSTGINVTNVLRGYLSELYEWTQHIYPPATLMLICGPQQLQLLSPYLFDLQCEGYTILVAHPGRARGSGWLWKSFLSVVSKEWLWTSLLKGSEDNNKQEVVEDACSEACATFCSVCECHFFGKGSFEDFTTHLKSKEHAEEVSDSFAPPVETSPSTSTIVKRELQGNKRDMEIEQEEEEGMVNHKMKLA